jgi:hypothetical protein
MQGGGALELEAKGGGATGYLKFKLLSPGYWLLLAAQPGPSQWPVAGGERERGEHPAP